MIETKLTFTYVTPLQGRRKTYTLRTVGQTKKSSKEKVMKMSGHIRKHDLVFIWFVFPYFWPLDTGFGYF